MDCDSSSPGRETYNVTQCFEKWSDRFIINGVSYHDLKQLKQRIDTWDEWCGAFAAFGEDHVKLGEQAVERNDMEGAAEHFVQASKYFHFGSFVWHEDEDRREVIHRKAVENYLRGGQYLDPPVQRIDVPYTDSGTQYQIPGYLRVPDKGPEGSSNACPLVVLYPGLDSTKEELSLYEPHLHKRGLATLTIEGPGQGEMWEQRRMTPEYPKFISAVIDYMEDQSFEGVRVKDLGALGQSLGGFYAPYVAAHDQRFDACVGFSGPFSIGSISRWDFNIEIEQFQHACKTDSMVEIDEIAEELSLRDVIEDLTIPTLMITGGRDTIVPAVQTQRIAERAPKGEFLLFEEGIHVCRNVPYKCQPRAADWLRKELAE